MLAVLVFLGIVTFVRTVQTSVDDAVFARHIETIRDQYAALLPELAPILSTARSLDSYFESAQRSRLQRFVGVSGSIAVITSVLSGALTGVVLYFLAGSLLGGLLVAVLVGGVALLAFLSWQKRLWARSQAFPST